MKDPLLAQYSIEELAYEYFDHTERQKYAQEVQEEETDKIEEAKFSEAEKWAEEEEAKERQAKEQQAAEQPQEPQPMTDDEWMEKQMLLEKEQHGDSFGEDISEEFE
jgi:hypothetical protein